MKLALIPPVSQLHDIHLTDYQLMLPHMLDDVEYKEAYSLVCKDPSQYVILDNGAAEGASVGHATLARLAQKYNVNEVVAPDVLRDAAATAARSTAFITYLKSLAPGDWEYQRRIGVVAQGANEEEAYECIMRMFDNSDIESWVDVIYLPRLLVHQRDHMPRIRLAKKLNEAVNGNTPSGNAPVEFHFLGASSFWPKEIRAAVDDVPFVRGMDTSMPYNYGIWYQSIDGGQQLQRPERYFQTELDPTQESWAASNRNMMIAWAHGMDGVEVDD
jgi:hypothetical protein